MLVMCDIEKNKKKIELKFVFFSSRLYKLKSIIFVLFQWEKSFLKFSNPCN